MAARKFGSLSSISAARIGPPAIHSTSRDPDNSTSICQAKLTLSLERRNRDLRAGLAVQAIDRAAPHQALEQPRDTIVPLRVALAVRDHRDMTRESRCNPIREPQRSAAIEIAGDDKRRDIRMNRVSIALW